MKMLAILALTLPFGGNPPPKPPGWTQMELAGMVLLIGPPKGTGIGMSGLTAESEVHALGGDGTVKIRRGLTLDADVTLREIDAAQLAALFDLPEFLRGKIVGRVGLVEVSVRQDKFTLKASGFRIPGDPVARIEATGDLKAKTVKAVVKAMGGIIEYSGRIPE